MDVDLNAELDLIEYVSFGVNSYIVERRPVNGVSWLTRKALQAAEAAQSATSAQIAMLKLAKLELEGVDQSKLFLGVMPDPVFGEGHTVALVKTHRKAGLLPWKRKIVACYYVMDTDTHGVYDLADTEYRGHLRIISYADALRASAEREALHARFTFNGLSPDPAP